LNSKPLSYKIRCAATASLEPRLFLKQESAMLYFLWYIFF